MYQMCMIDGAVEGQLQVQTSPSDCGEDGTPSATSWRRLVFRQNVSAPGPDSDACGFLDRLPDSFVVGALYTNDLQLISMPECILPDPGIYVMQFSDGHNFMNVFLNCAGCGGKQAWAFRFIKEAQMFSSYNVEYFYCRSVPYTPLSLRIRTGTDYKVRMCRVDGVPSFFMNQVRGQNGMTGLVGVPVLCFPEYWAEAGCLRTKLRGDACTLSVEVIKVQRNAVGPTHTNATYARGLCRVLVSDGQQHAWLLAEPAHGDAEANPSRTPFMTTKSTLTCGDLAHLVVRRITTEHLSGGDYAAPYTITEIVGVARYGDASRSRRILKAGRKFIVSRWAVMYILYTGLKDKLLPRLRLTARMVAAGLDPASYMAILNRLALSCTTGPAEENHEWGDSLREQQRWRLDAGLWPRVEAVLDSRCDLSKLPYHADRVLLITR